MMIFIGINSRWKIGLSKKSDPGIRIHTDSEVACAGEVLQVLQPIKRAQRQRKPDCDPSE